MSIKDLSDSELRQRAEKHEAKQRAYHQRHNVKIRLQAKWAKDQGYEPTESDIDAELNK